MPVIWVRTKAEYFYAKGWTGFTDLPVGQFGAIFCDGRMTALLSRSLVARPDA
jgi:hypothetical protein